MHPTVLKNRAQDAQDRIVTAVEALSKSLHIPDEITDNLSFRYRNKDVEGLTRIEAVADALEHIAEGFKEHKSKLRAAKRQAKEANDEADAMQSKLSEIENLNAQIVKLKSENAELKSAAKDVPPSLPAQPQEANPLPSSPASLDPGKSGGEE
jgi:DNA repair ATPase RecN